MEEEEDGRIGLRLGHGQVLIWVRLKFLKWKDNLIFLKNIYSDDRKIIKMGHTWNVITEKDLITITLFIRDYITMFSYFYL